MELTRKLRAATMAGAMVASLLVSGAAALTVAAQPAAASEACIAGTDIWNVGTNQYITADPNGTLHASGSTTANAATHLTVCDTDGNVSIFSEYSHGWFQDVGWSNNIVLAHVPRLDQSDMTQDFLLPMANGRFVIRARGNTLYVQPTTPGNVLYATGRSVDQWTEWGTDDPRLSRLICPGCIAVKPTGITTRPAPTATGAPTFQQVYDNEFGSNENTPVGGFTGCSRAGCTGAPQARLGAQPDGQRDSSGHCIYDTTKVSSISGGHLNMHVFKVNGGPCYSVNMHPVLPDFTYGKYRIRFRADDIPRYHFVTLLWPADRQTGEIDGPEANLGNPWHGFIHATAGGSQFSIEVQQDPPEGWHTFEVDWLPAGQGGISMFIDGKKLTNQGAVQPVPNTPMHVAFHVESWMGTSLRPTMASHGNVQIDYLKIFKET